MSTGAGGRTPGKGRSFVLGAIGCLATFFCVGLVIVAVGGTMYLDLGGAVLLFLVGGIIGLVVNSIYQRGRRDAAQARDETIEGPRP